MLAIQSDIGICLGNRSQNINFIASVTTNSFMVLACLSLTCFFLVVLIDQINRFYNQCYVNCTRFFDLLAEDGTSLSAETY